jgi:uncharacterized BrkB/YihY/UPF0761 family membrane protein
MTLESFAASLSFGILLTLLPLVLFVAMVAVCVAIARWIVRMRSAR